MIKLELEELKRIDHGVSVIVTLDGKWCLLCLTKQSKVGGTAGPNRESIYMNRYWLQLLCKFPVCAAIYVSPSGLTTSIASRTKQISS